MSWPLAYAVAPLILHTPTRLALPRDTRTHLATWLTRHPILHAGIPARAASLAPYVREGLRYGIRTSAISLAAGELSSEIPQSATDDPLEVLYSRSRFVGRWFAKHEQPSTVLALLGVTP
jgi:hypothetical protein